MDGNEITKVLFSGTDDGFCEELKNWFAAERMAVDVSVPEGDPNTWVICSMSQQVASELHRRLSGEGSKPFFVDAIFPIAVASSPRSTVIRGPAREAQEKLIEELAPMTATPNAPRRPDRRTTRKRAARVSFAKS